MHRRETDHAEALRHMAAGPPAVRSGEFRVIITHHGWSFARSQWNRTRDAEHDPRLGDRTILFVQNASADGHGRLQPQCVIRGNLIDAVLLVFRPAQVLGHVTVPEYFDAMAPESDRNP